MNFELILEMMFSSVLKGTLS